MRWLACGERADGVKRRRKGGSGMESAPLLPMLSGGEGDRKRADHRRDLLLVYPKRARGKDFERSMFFLNFARISKLAGQPAHPGKVEITPGPFSAYSPVP